MWMNLLIATVCVPLVCSQCDYYEICNEQEASTPYLKMHSQHSVSQSEFRHNVKPEMEATLSTDPPVQRTTTPRQPVSHNPPSPVVFPDQYHNPQIPTETFSAKLFELMSAVTKGQNLVYSPISLQTLLTFIFTISEGKLSQELARLLELPNNRSFVAQSYKSIHNSPYNTNMNNTLNMANKLYYDQRHGDVNQNVRNLAINSFASEVESVDFQTPFKATEVINSWVAQKTRNLINNIVSPSSLSPDVNAILVNSLYFKSLWQKKFSTYDTEKQQFFLNRQTQVPVDMMNTEDIFPYGEFEDLQAKVVELPYQLADFRMMIILPNKIDGLPEVERRLARTSLTSISDSLQNAEVIVKLPQFKIEFEVDMVQPLQQLGLFSLFNDNARIILFKNQWKPLTVDQIKHKTYISVNEAGTEAAAAAFAKFVPLSIPVHMKQFTADHPFIFLIHNSKATYFVGHVAQF